MIRKSLFYCSCLGDALKVRDLIVVDGIPHKSISVASHGECNPLIKTVDNVPESRNRKIEVIVR